MLRVRVEAGEWRPLSNAQIDDAQHRVAAAAGRFDVVGVVALEAQSTAANCKRRCRRRRRVDEQRQRGKNVEKRRLDGGGR